MQRRIPKITNLRRNPGLKLAKTRAFLRVKLSGTSLNKANMALRAFAQAAENEDKINCFHLAKELRIPQERISIWAREFFEQTGIKIMNQNQRIARKKPVLKPSLWEIAFGEKKK